MKNELSPVLDLADEILALLENNLTKNSPELRSSSLTDSIVWTIIIGFLASVAANFFTKGLPVLGNGQLKEKDLEEIGRVFNEVVCREEALQEHQVETVVRASLPSYLSSVERQRLTSEITRAIIASCRSPKRKE